ncbi:zinc-dependent alcohol dehydrogenase [Microbacterium testaceum]|uniref:zinc-dependent alcohol dehydrogenase n=1 Tax=Microbacterium testaceum TaxID=2033 RepID=UPI0012492D50|nr:alcohol dehydrogenase catalytic domain-containing protein [Microbacterium testaceum]
MSTNTLTGSALVKFAEGAGSLELRQVEVGPAQAGQALVAVAAAGICGTDLHIADGEWAVNPPVTVGHEFSGTVVSVGDGVDPDWVGSRVVSEVFFGSDETCDACQSGHRNLCPNRQSLGSHVDGAFAPAVLVPVRNLHRLPDSIGLTEAALLEPLACVVGALCDPSVISAGDRVLVTGPGAIGLFAAQVARAHGGQVTMLGREADRRRLAVAENLGLRVEVTESSADESRRERFDVVIECAGAAPAVSSCLAAVRRRGRYVQLGLFGGPISVDLSAICLKDLTLTSGFGATPEGFRRAIRMVADGLVSLEPLITQIAPLHEWESVIAATRRGDGVKFLFAPQA